MKVWKVIVAILSALALVWFISRASAQEFIEPFPSGPEAYEDPLPGVKGFCDKKFGIVPGDLVEVSTAELNLREAPGLRAQVLWVLNHNDHLSVLNQDPRCLNGYTWFNVAFANEGSNRLTGWVAYGRAYRNPLIQFIGRFINWIGLK